MVSPSPSSAWKRFVALEISGSIVLIAATIIAMICANSSIAPHYYHMLHMKIGVHVNDLFVINYSVEHWINDGLMVLFFFVVGMEIKRELKEGELCTRQKAILPFLAAVGGVVSPALIFSALNWGDETTMRGWAIPSATDIAFAVGVLSMFGKRVPSSLKVFLLAVAVIDDLMAVLIIAVFYTSHLSFTALAIAWVCIGALYVCNQKGVARVTPYAILGFIMWLAVLQSGIHATIAGVILGFMIPLKAQNSAGVPMLDACRHALHEWVTFLIMPIFALANAGVQLDGLTLNHLLHPVPLGIGLGLFFGKQFGIFIVSYSVIKLKIADFPSGATWAQFYGICIMCGIGFTMSLFVGNLAYQDAELLTYTKLGVLLGSISSVCVGSIMLGRVLKR
ncbi:MAG: Na+/H+ antiporter NhaA [Alphaproteobacteria bacterium]|nr:MAG: Na+/H+ antiporter NhaA [Alphaproteobacteria bacterium]TAF41067.1 MAG: Na+/H+ antiporter NhaA [Alphaproteobacteria bacterium]TAF76321.1 MAG: Na+/H+ antiporter NhaA [Alphaproteobacteria bacterium]